MYVLDVIRQGQPRNLYTFVIRKQAENNLHNICLQAMVAKIFDKVLSGRMFHQRVKIFRHFRDWFFPLKLLKVFTCWRGSLPRKTSSKFTEGFQIHKASCTQDQDENARLISVLRQQYERLSAEETTLHSYGEFILRLWLTSY